MQWFIAGLGRALDGTENTLAAVLLMARFWESWRRVLLDVRQLLMLNQLLDGFEGKLTSSKWAKIANCSQDTAGRDIQALIDTGMLIRDQAGGRSTSYSLKETEA